MDFIDRLKYIKIEDEEGNLSENVPIGADAENIDFDENQNIKQKINSVESSMRKKDTKIEMSDLSQEIKEAMTGGAVPVVGDNSVTNSSIQDFEISPNKTNFVDCINNNLLDITKINDYYYNPSGSTSTGNYVSSDFIDIGEYEVGNTEFNSNVTRGAYIFFNSDKEFIKYIGQNTHLTIDVEGVKYIKMNISKNVLSDNLWLVKGNATNYIVNTLKSVRHYMNNNILIPTENLVGNSINPDNTNFIEHVSNNLYNKFFVDKYGYFSNVGKYYKNEDAGSMSEYCSIIMNLPEYNISETVFYQGQGTGFINIFDNNFSWIGSISDSNKSTFTIPYENGVYITKSLKLSEIDDYFLIAGTNELIDYYKLKDFILLPKLSPLVGKKIGFLGDSITYGLSATKPYPTVIQENIDCSSINYGISGNSLAKAGSNGQQNAQERPMCIRYTEMDDDLDYIVVFGGTNDYAYQIPLGNENSTNVEEFFGGLNTLISGLIEKYPGKPILFLTPLYRTLSYDSTGVKFLDYVDAIKSRCAYYSIPCFNLTENSTIKSLINTINNLYYANGDRLHPNDEGHKILARIIQHQLEKI